MPYQCPTPPGEKCGLNAGNGKALSRTTRDLSQACISEALQALEITPGILALKQVTPTFTLAETLSTQRNYSSMQPPKTSMRSLRLREKTGIITFNTGRFPCYTKIDSNRKIKCELLQIIFALLALFAANYFLKFKSCQCAIELA